MLRRARRWLFTAGLGRNLAVDLVERHGEAAIAILDRRLAASDLGEEERAILEVGLGRIG